MVVGTGHTAGALLLGDASTQSKLQTYLNAYNFELLNKPYSLFQFHTGYSFTMAALFIFIGLLCLMITNPNKKILGTLCLGAIIIAGMVLNYFVLLPQTFTCIALIAFVLAFFKYKKVTPIQTQ